ncbi:MAG: ZIP family metal transporter [Gammaproteobacteria bacterium]|jgi:zinc and cadmium transporter
MDTLSLILLATALGGIASALLAGILLWLPVATRDRVLPHAVSFATGALLATALVALVPHAIEGAGTDHVHGVGLALLAGIAIFFVLEKFLLWRHCHTEAVESAHTHADHHHASSGWLVLVGDGLHNFVDGVLIAAAFLTDVHLGIVTTFAILAHEIPQEVGNVAVLLHSGFSRRQALAWNVLSSLTAVVGGLVGWFALRESLAVLPYVLAVAAASLLYVAVADLIPGLHRRTDLRASLAQVAWIAIGVGVVMFAESHVH